MLWSFSLKVVDLVTLRKFWICVGGKQRNKYGGIHGYVGYPFFKAFSPIIKEMTPKTHFKNTSFKRPKRDSQSIKYPAIMRQIFFYKNKAISFIIFLTTYTVV